MRILIALLAILASAPARAAEFDRALWTVLSTKDEAAMQDAADTLLSATEERHLPRLASEIQAMGEALEQDPLALRRARLLIDVASRVPSPLALEVLVELLDSAAAPIARAAADRMVLDPSRQWVPAYLDRLQAVHVGVEHRLELLDALADGGAADVLKELLPIYPLLADDAVRARALEALAVGDVPGHRRLCREALRSGGELEKRAAICVLVLDGEKEAVEGFARILETGGFSCEEIQTTVEHLVDVRRIREVQRQLLLLLFEHEICTEALLVLVEAARVHRESRADEALRALITTKKDPALVAQSVRALLAVLEEEKVDPAIREFGAHALPGVRLVVGEARLARDDAGAVDVVVAFVDSVDPELSKAALATLSRHKFRKTVTPLIKALRLPAGEQREAVKVCLQAHLDLFFPYRTPRLESFDLSDKATSEYLDNVIGALLGWLEQQP